jgi:hypothetical protein
LEKIPAFDELSNRKPFVHASQQPISSSSRREDEIVTIEVDDGRADDRFPSYEAAGRDDVAGATLGAGSYKETEPFWCRCCVQLVDVHPTF